MASILKKILWLLLIGSLFSIFALNFGSCYSPNATVPFSYNELSGQIMVTAPVRNFTYSESDIVVNVSLHIGGHEYEPNTHYVPYQNISCAYSLDDFEWQEMSLVSVGGHEAFCSLVNPYWYSNTWLNYTATLHNVSEGSHYLRIDVKPDSIRTRDISSSQDQPLVYFNVMPSIPQEVEPAQPPDTTSPAPDLLLILSSALVLAVVAVAALVYWKKRKHKPDRETDRQTVTD